MSYFAKAEEKKKLQQLTSPEGRDSLYWYNQKENRSVLEVSNVFTIEFNNKALVVHTFACYCPLTSTFVVRK